MPDKFNDLEYISENIKIQFKPDGYERLEIYRADKSKMTELFPICVGHGEMHLNISGKIIIDDEIWIVDFFNLLMDASVFSILYKKEAIFNVYDNAFYMKIFRKKRKFVIERCTSSTEISTSHVQEEEYFRFLCMLHKYVYQNGSLHKLSEIGNVNIEGILDFSPDVFFR